MLKKHLLLLTAFMIVSSSLQAAQENNKVEWTVPLSAIPDVRNSNDLQQESKFLDLYYPNESLLENRAIAKYCNQKNKVRELTKKINESKREYFSKKTAASVSDFEKYFFGLDLGFQKAARMAAYYYNKENPKSFCDLFFDKTIERF
jgi:hypothetical protein